MALDASTVLVAEFPVLLHEGRVARAASDYTKLDRVVREWFPVRDVTLEAALHAPGDAEQIDSRAALVLAEALRVPLVMKNDEIASRVVPVLRA